MHFASGALFKRLGYLVEALELPIPERTERLAAWRKQLTAGVALLDPGELAGGSVHLRWRIRDNIDLASLTESAQ